MFLVKRSALLFGFGHAAKLDDRKWGASPVLFWLLLCNRNGCATLAQSMRWLDKLERRFGFLGIPGLIRIVVGFDALVFILVRLNPGYLSILDLDPTRIRHGEVWRLVTYIFIPQTRSLLWIIFVLWFLWWIGEGLEHAFGAFRLTLYFFLGMIGTTAAAFFFGSNFSNSMLIASLFYAFAWFYPEEIIYLFFILPVKIKWIAWVLAALLFAGFALNPISYRMAVIAAFANYLIFFGPSIFREARQRREVSSRRRRFDDTSRREDEPLHKCAVCGATELSDPTLEFRVAKDGEEYCLRHLRSSASASSGSER
jgi:membrane associated rhomboid family serine protease